jgi:glutaconyl-CoA/methylmalonyl-CoA decarboxylase subunit gamma
MQYFVTFPSGDQVPVEVDHLPTGEIEVVVDGKRLSADAVSVGGSVVGATSMRIDGRMVDLWMEGKPPGVGVIARGHRFYVEVESERQRALAAALGPRASAAGDGTLLSPMPGRVLKLLVAEGATVEAGAALVVVEAMKMENELCAARSGTVRKIHVSPGQNVESGARLVEIE